MKKRLCIFAHFDKDSIVDDHVRYYLAALKDITAHLSFVSTSPLSDQVSAGLRGLSDSTLIRENRGYDFASWSVGLHSVYDIEIFDELILCNDSVYGPLFPLENMFNKMDNIACDFWGVTDNREGFYHLQSYFLVFKKRVINSEEFKSFFRLIKTESIKKIVIHKYEIGLTQTLIKAGFKPAVYARKVPSYLKIATLDIIDLMKVDFIKTTYKWLFKKPVNVTQYYWKELISNCQSPFIKVELLRDNPYRLRIGDFEYFLHERTDYPVELINRHLHRVKIKNLPSQTSLIR